MIYIVEDDAAIRELEQYALQSSGYEVASFESSEPFWQAMKAAQLPFPAQAAHHYGLG